LILADLAKQRFEENFRAESYAQRIEELLDRVLAQPHARLKEAERDLIGATIEMYQTLYNKALTEASTKSPLSFNVKRLRRRVGRAILDWKNRTQS
jgi:hypothetical protein